MPSPQLNLGAFPEALKSRLERFAEERNISVAAAARLLISEGLTLAEGKGAWISTLHIFPSTMAQNFWIAIFAWSACFAATVLVSLLSRPKAAADLHGLVYGLTEAPRDRGVIGLSLAVLALTVILNIIFW